MYPKMRIHQISRRMKPTAQNCVLQVASSQWRFRTAKHLRYIQSSTNNPQAHFQFSTGHKGFQTFTTLPHIIGPRSFSTSSGDEKNTQAVPELVPPEAVQATAEASLKPGVLIDPSVSAQAVEATPVLAELGTYPTDYLIRYFEFLHTSLDIPYWGAILTGTLLIRTALAPISIKSIKNGARMAIMRPELERLTDKMKKDTEKSTAKQFHYQKEMRALFKKHQCNPVTSMAFALAQLPVFMTCFFGLKKMGEYIDITQGGAYWFMDLSVPDATYGLPLFCSASFLAMVEVGADGMNAGPNANIMKQVMRVMSVLMVPLTVNIPQSVLIYWCASNSFALGQSLLLKVPGVKPAIGIPEVPDHLKQLNSAEDPFNNLLTDVKKVFGAVDESDAHTQEILHGKKPAQRPPRLKEGEALGSDGKTVVKVFSQKPKKQKD